MPGWRACAGCGAHRSCPPAAVSRTGHCPGHRACPTGHSAGQQCVQAPFHHARPRVALLGHRRAPQSATGTPPQRLPCAEVPRPSPPSAGRPRGQPLPLPCPAGPRPLVVGILSARANAHDIRSSELSLTAAVQCCTALSEFMRSPPVSYPAPPPTPQVWPASHTHPCARRAGTTSRARGRTRS